MIPSAITSAPPLPARRGAAVLTGLLLALAGLRPPPSPADEPAGQRPGPPPTLTAEWTGIALRDLCDRLGEITGRPVILDRRLDPSRRLTLAAEDEPLDTVLVRIATAGDAGCAILPASIRFVPREGASRLVAAERDRAAAIAALPAEARRVALGRQTWSWPDGATPRDLLAGLADGAGIELVGLDQIPHDHLAAADLAPLPLAERLDLLLAQFDRRIDWSAWRESTAAATPARVPIVTLPRGGPGGDGPLVAAPGAWAPVAAQPPSRGDTAGRPAAGRPTWTLEVAAPLDQLLATVAKRLDLELDLDRDGLRAKGIAAGEIVRLKVKEVDRDELLDRILEPLALDWSIEGGRLWVGPAGR